ncbi:MAG: SDR family NAD(P)-dependent oxidoreductase [Christensenellales bacterium]
MKYTRDDLAFLKIGRMTQHSSSEPMSGRLCVVSGATSGVGLSAARRLAAGGAHLVLVCRSREKGEALKAQLTREHGVAVDLVIADFCDLASVRAAAGAILQRHQAIDVLINSAGVHCTRRHLTRDGNEMAFQVNHIAPFLLTMLLMDALKRSPQGRVIQVNSEGHRFGGLNLQDLDWQRRPYIGLRAYGASKIAQIMTVRTLAERLKADSAVTINAMHPGGVRTNIGRNNGWLYRAWLRGVVWHFLKDPAISGEALYYLASAPELSHTSGRYFNLTIDCKPMLGAVDEADSAAVFQTSLRLSGLPL